MFYRTLIPAFTFLLLSCGSEGASSPDSVNRNPAAIDSSSADRYDTSITISRYGGVEIVIRKNDTLFEKLKYNDPDYDTTFYSDGGVKEIAIKRIYATHREQYFRYDHDDILRYKYTLYSLDGMGGSEAERLFYDTTGLLITKEINRDYMPVDAQGHLDICGVVTTTTYYSNGQPQSIEITDHHYEGLTWCPCGTWEYFDSAGRVIRTERYKKCGDGKTDCVEDH